MIKTKGVMGSLDIKDWIDIFEWIFGISILILSFRLTIRQFRIVRTISYLERINSPSMLKIRADLDKWSELTDKKKKNQFEKDPELFYEINLLYNLLTEVAISFKYKVIHRKMACELFDPMIPSLIEKLRFFIDYQRERKKKVGYFLEYLTDKIEQYHKGK